MSAPARDGAAPLVAYATLRREGIAGPGWGFEPGT